MSELYNLLMSLSLFAMALGLLVVGVGAV